MSVVIYKRMASTTTLGDKTVQNRLNCIFNAEMQPVGAYANVFNTITYTYTYAAAPTRVESTDRLVIIRTPHCMCTNIM